MQCKLIANKDKKIENLQQENKKYEQQLEQLMNSHEDILSQYSELEKQQKRYNDMIQVQTLRAEMFQNSINSLLSQRTQKLAKQIEVTENLNNISEQNKVINMRLFQKQQEVHELQLLIDRMKAQLKMYANQNSGTNSLIKACEKKKQALDSSVKMLEIMERKYQSLYKFLNILRSKSQKEEQQRQEKKKKQTIDKAGKTTYKQLEQYRQSNIKKNENVDNTNETKNKISQQSRKNAQKFADLTRKKNMIMLKKR